MAAVTHGCAIVLPGESFDPEATLRAISTERCTSIYGVPTMFIAQLNHAAFETFCLDSLRTGIMAGASCPVDVMRRVIDRMHVRDVTICYGMTETSPVSFQSAMDDPIDVRVSTVGRIHPHVECKIIDPQTGGIVPRGTRGELCTRGYVVMLGYWDDEAATARAIDAARWMHTGDLATMNADGYVSISGRIDDMIIRGGENIYPREIEEFLHTHPKITQASVIGVPDQHYGEAGVRVDRGPRRRDRHGRRGAGVLPRSDLHLQDSALRPLDVRFPDDGHGKDPEVQDARDLRRGTRVERDHKDIAMRGGAAVRRTILFATMMLLGAVRGAHAQQSCDSLAAVKLANTTITATLVAEGPFAGVDRPRRRGTADHYARALRSERRHPPHARF